MNKLFLGDCLEVMKELPDNSIDMILADLPYEKTGSNWDIIIPFDLLWKEYKRIRKSNSCIALFGNEPFTSMLIMSNLSEFRYKWSWEKEQGGNFQLAKLQPLSVIEDICIFSDGKTANGAKNNMRYYPIMEKRSIPTRSGGNPSVSNILHSNSMVALKRTYHESYPKNILRYHKPHSSKRLHPNQKPVELLEYLIKTYTLQGDLILDNTMGSGSTIVAAKNLNRQYIGIEKDVNYYNIAYQRINNSLGD